MYYIATEDPNINIARVQYRVKTGGHAVTAEKISERYKRSLNLLPQALKFTNRAYIFDNSDHKYIWLAEVTNGTQVEIKSTKIPIWFKNSLANK